MHAKDTIRINAPVEDVDRLALPPEAWSRYFVGMSEPERIWAMAVRVTSVRDLLRLAVTRFVT